MAKIGKICLICIAVSAMFLSCKKDCPAFLMKFSAEKQGKTVYFNNESLGPDSYYWDFGDGSHSYEENPTHRYSTFTFYRVTLRGTSGDCSETCSEIVTIKDDY
ncbi:MAG: PKD domain-containing protein [Bacteroidales bacterium]|jgi:PKD repeat protein|nr:PKD domain-containing protein [Bacteroidales bacterium]